MTAENEPTNGDENIGNVILHIGAIISSCSLIINISYFILSVCKKRKEEYTNTRFLSTQFLISSITCCLYINCYNYYLAFKSGSGSKSFCLVVMSLRTLSITPTICSCACVAVSTFLVINKRHLLKQNSRMFRVIFFLLGWGPSTLVVVISLITLSTTSTTSTTEDYSVDKNYCVYNNTRSDSSKKTGNYHVISILTFCYQMLYLVVLYIVCIVVLKGICKLNSQGDIEIKKAIKQLMKKVAGYMVGITIFSVFAVFTNLTQSAIINTKGVLPYFQLFFSIMDPALAHLFVVNRRFLSDWVSFYTCKKDIAEIKEDSQEISNNLKLKSSVNQQFDDDDDDDDDE